MTNACKSVVPVGVIATCTNPAAVTFEDVTDDITDDELLATLGTIESNATQVIDLPITCTNGVLQPLPQPLQLLQGCTFNGPVNVNINYK
jgi:hypothetical protein